MPCPSQALPQARQRSLRMHLLPQLQKASLPIYSQGSGPLTRVSNYWFPSFSNHLSCTLPCTWARWPKPTEARRRSRTVDFNRSYMPLCICAYGSCWPCPKSLLSGSLPRRRLMKGRWHNTELPPGAVWPGGCGTAGCDGDAHSLWGWE